MLVQGLLQQTGGARLHNRDTSPSARQTTAMWRMQTMRCSPYCPEHYCASRACHIPTGHQRTMLKPMLGSMPQEKYPPTSGVQQWD